MNKIKSIIVIVVTLFSISSYSQNVIFDNQDNVVLFNNSWSQSWDLINDIPENQEIAIKVDYQEDRLVIQSNTYYLVDIEFTNALDDYDISYNEDYSIIYLEYYGLSQHVYNDDLFKFNIKYKKRSKKCNCVSIYAVDYFQGIYTYPNEIYIIVENLENNSFQLYEYINQGYCIELYDDINYRITVARTEDLFVRSVFNFSYSNPPKFFRKCTIKTKMLHYE